MNLPTTQPALSENARLILFLTKKTAKIAIRWSIATLLGLIVWVLFDPLPPVFFWSVMVMMLGAMSIHTVLHQQNKTTTFAKQACRYAFFLSFPMLFVFAGNRLAVWSTSDESRPLSSTATLPSVQGAIPTAEYLLLKELQKEQFKDPVKTRKGLKQVLSKQLKKYKQMDPATKTLLIIIGIVLLVVILVLVAILVGINQSVNSCTGSDDDGCL